MPSGNSGQGAAAPLGARQGMRNARDFESLIPAMRALRAPSLAAPSPLGTGSGRPAQATTTVAVRGARASTRGVRGGGARPPGQGRAAAAADPAAAKARAARERAIRASLTHKRAVERTIFERQAELSGPRAVSAQRVKLACEIFQPQHWDEVSLERTLAGACAYPLCGQDPKDRPTAKITTVLESAKVPGKQAKRKYDSPVEDDDEREADEGIDAGDDFLAENVEGEEEENAAHWNGRRPRRVLGLIEAMLGDADLVSFCSRECCLKSQFVRIQLCADPVYLRAPKDKHTSIVLAEEHQKEAPVDPTHQYISDLLQTPLGAPPIEATIIERELVPASSPSSSSEHEACMAPPADPAAHENVEGHRITIVVPNKRAQEGASRPSAKARKANVDDRPSRFTAMVSLFGSLVTPETKRYVHRQPPPPHAFPRSAHSDDEEESGEHAAEQTEDGPLPLRLDRRLQVDTFFKRLSAALQKDCYTLQLDESTRSVLVNEVLEMAKTFDITPSAVSAVQLGSPDATLVAVICLLGACQRAGGDLKERLIGSQGWTHLFDVMAARDERAGRRRVTGDDAEYMARHIFE